MYNILKNTHAERGSEDPGRFSTKPRTEWLETLILGRTWHGCRAILCFPLYWLPSAPHTFTVWSELAEASRLPSGLKATLPTGPGCPRVSVS